MGIRKFKTRLKPAFTLIDLTPLVDVVFLLLIFFVFTSDVLPLKSLDIQNPSLETEAPSLTTQLLVVMDSQNVIYVGSKKNISDFLSLEAMTRHELEQLRKRHPNASPSLVLSVDRRVEYGEFLRLFSELQKLELPMRLVFHHERT